MTFRVIVSPQELQQKMKDMFAEKCLEISGGDGRLSKADIQKYEEQNLLEVNLATDNGQKRGSIRRAKSIFKKATDSFLESTYPSRPNIRLRPVDLMGLQMGRALEESQALPKGLTQAAEGAYLALRETKINAGDYMTLESSNGAQIESLLKQSELSAETPLAFGDGAFGNESGNSPIEVVRIAGPFNHLDNASWQKALGVTTPVPKTSVERLADSTGDLTVAEFFNAARNDSINNNFYSCAALAQMQDTMQNRLREMGVFIVGDDGVIADHPVYAVGLSEDGDIVGLRTNVIWT